MSKEHIYKERNRIGIERQPSIESEHSLLKNEISNQGKTHPYDGFEELEFIGLKECCTCFCDCCKLGIKASSIPEYLYRIIPVSRMGRDSTKWKGLSLDFYEFRDRYFSNESDWLNLGLFLSGFIRNKRGFSWWTNEVPDRIEKVFKLGLVSNWIIEESIILRVKTTKIKKEIFIPRTLEGFDQVIFMPVKENSSKNGFTINLNNIENFPDGYNEYVLPEIDVNKIEFRTILFDKSSKRIYLENILNELHSHYKKMIL
jgi:hypothetical protein